VQFEGFPNADKRSIGNYSLGLFENAVGVISNQYCRQLKSVSSPRVGTASWRFRTVAASRRRGQHGPCEEGVPEPSTLAVLSFSLAALSFVFVAVRRADSWGCRELFGQIAEIAPALGQIQAV